MHNRILQVLLVVGECGDGKHFGTQLATSTEAIDVIVALFVRRFSNPPRGSAGTRLVVATHTPTYTPKHDYQIC